MGMVGLRDVFVVAGPHHHHHHHLNLADHHHHLNASNPATALGVGVIPLLSAAPLDPSDAVAAAGPSSARGIHLWQQSQQGINNNNNNNHQSHFFKSPIGSPNFAGPPGGSTTASAAAAAAAAANTATCQDCGNQAKKDCPHRRCRTCCKSRGYECATHVKSTWVPAARRRERQLLTAPGSSGSTSGVKKPRLTTTSQTTSTSNTTPPRSFDTTSSHQEASFRETLPGQVRAPAVFKCVRVTAVEDGEDEYAYQAVVKIGGHVFKGFLYDQGAETSRDPFPNLSELHLGGATAASAGGRNNNGDGAASSSPPPILDPSDVYAASAGGFLQGGGSSYGNPIN